MQCREGDAVNISATRAHHWLIPPPPTCLSCGLFISGTGSCCCCYCCYWHWAQGGSRLVSVYVCGEGGVGGGCMSEYRRRRLVMSEYKHRRLVMSEYIRRRLVMSEYIRRRLVMSEYRHRRLVMSEYCTVLGQSAVPTTLGWFLVGNYSSVGQPAVYITLCWFLHGFWLATIQYSSFLW